MLWMLLNGITRSLFGLDICRRSIPFWSISLIRSATFLHSCILEPLHGPVLILGSASEIIVRSGYHIEHQSTSPSTASSAPAHATSTAAHAAACRSAPLIILTVPLAGALISGGTVCALAVQITGHVPGTDLARPVTHCSLLG